MKIFYILKEGNKREEHKNVTTMHIYNEIVYFLLHDHIFKAVYLSSIDGQIYVMDED